MTRRRVVVTGLGVVAGNGLGAASFWSALKDGRAAIRPLTRFDASRYKSALAAEVSSLSDGSAVRDRATRLLLAAGAEAMADARLGQSPRRVRRRIGVVIGTIHAGLITTSRVQATLLRGRTPPAPSLFRECALWAPAWRLARQLRLGGPRAVVTTACTSGAVAIAYAASLVQCGRADVVLAGGVDTLNEFVFSGFDALRLLSSTACKPFDRERDGLVIGEGSAVLVLESFETAARRAAHVYCELAGWGSAGTAAPAGDGSAESEVASLIHSMTQAFDEAEVRPGDIDYVNAHAIGAGSVDAVEAEALQRMFCFDNPRVPVSSTKGFTGHTMGAAGALDAAVCALVIREGFVPGTRNHAVPDASNRLNVVPTPGIQKWIRAALSTSLGFGGQSAALIFRRPPKAGLAAPRAGARDEPARVVLTGIGSTSIRRVKIGRVARYLECDGALSEGPPDDALLAEVCDVLGPAASRDIARMDPMAWHALLAAHLAMADAGLPVPDDPRGYTGVIMGTALGSLESDLQYGRCLLVGHMPSAVLFRHTSANIPATQMARWLRCRGVNVTIASGIVAGLQAIAHGYDLIRHGRAERVLCGAVEWIGPAVADVLRRTRLYPNVSQGAAVVVLESLRSVERRGGAAYAEVKWCDIAYGRRSESAHPDQPLRGKRTHVAPGMTPKDRPPDGSALFGVISLLDRLSSLPTAYSGIVRHTIVLDGCFVETVLKHGIGPVPRKQASSDNPLDTSLVTLQSSRGVGPARHASAW